MKLTMVGAGYVGLVTGTCFANTGNDVVILDVVRSKIETLRKGECPIWEPGLTEMMRSNIKAGRLSFTTDADEAYADADMIFICVGTPSDEEGHADLKYVFSVADDIAAHIKKHGVGETKKLVVVKSTVPVGTTLEVKERIATVVGEGAFDVADNPEFLKEGAAIVDFTKPDRVVCGVENKRAGDLLTELYKPYCRQGHPIFIMDIRSSEMVKYASNNFLATKISFINEMARLCEAYGADITRVREGMCSDSRIGNQFLHPGLGYGGSCFPKDTLACISMGKRAGTPIDLSQAVHDVNQEQRRAFFAKIERHFEPEGGLAGKTLAFWGIAFKPNTDDIREAPSITLMNLATAAGAAVRAHDPVAMPNARAEMTGDINWHEDMYDALQGADALVICTDWDEFKSPDFSRMRTLLGGPVIFDGRNLYQHSQMSRTGFMYYSVGRPALRADTVTTSG